MYNKAGERRPTALLVVVKNWEPVYASFSNEMNKLIDVGPQNLCAALKMIL